MTEDQVENLRGHYDPAAIINQDEDLQRVINLLESGHFNQFEPSLFDGVIDSKVRMPRG